MVSYNKHQDCVTLKFVHSSPHIRVEIANSFDTAAVSLSNLNVVSDPCQSPEHSDIEVE